MNSFFGSKKLRYVQFWVWTSVAGSYVALLNAIPPEVIQGYWIGSGIALAGSMVGFGLSDAAHAKK